MAEQPQTIVEPAIPADKPLGARNEANLQAAFASSPIYAGELTDNERKEKYQSEALDGIVLNGLGLNSFDRDYDENDPPDFDDVETGGGGLPATPYVPNLSSPGPGSVFAGDQPPYTGEIVDSTSEFGSGLGGLTSPSETSKNMASQTLGDYISGRSYKGSDGS